MMSLMKASTVASERVPSPRERSGQPCILFGWGAAVGMLILLAKPILGPVGYGWGVFTVVGLLSLWLAWIDERTGALPNRIVGVLAVFGGIQIVGLVLTGRRTDGTGRGWRGGARWGALFRAGVRWRGGLRRCEVRRGSHARCGSHRRAFGGLSRRRRRHDQFVPDDRARALWTATAAPTWAVAGARRNQCAADRAHHVVVLQLC